MLTHDELSCAAYRPSDFAGRDADYSADADEPSASAATPARAAAAAAYPPEQFRQLRLRNRAGSVEHYFHFILGFTAPILLRPDGEQPGIRYIARSCGPFDRHFAELAVGDITLIPRQLWRDIRAERGVPAEQLYGFDRPDHYDEQAFAKLREIVMRRLDVTGPASGERLLVINRGKSPEFYQSVRAESELSANLRRSVPNMPEVDEAIRAAGMTPEIVELENSTLRDQVQLFANTRVVVAQHGAALANMLWMPKGGLIVEVLPRDVAPKLANFFSALAGACGHRYAAVKQKSAHAPVHVDKIVRALQAAK